MKKVLLIDPSYLINKNISKEFSLGLITIAGYVKKNLGNMFDLEYFMPPETSQMFFDEWINYLLISIKAIQPDIICFTTRCDTYPFTLVFLKKIKLIMPAVVIILGGVQATHTDIETMEKFEEINLIIRGEGEITFQQVLMSIANGNEYSNILGITFRTESGEIKRNKDREFIKKLSTYPDYLSIYQKNKKLMINRIEAGRGCPYNCVFCSLCDMWNRKFRLLEPKQIKEKMNEIYNINGSTYFVLEHDNLFANKKQAETMLKEMFEIGEKYSWACSSRIDSINNIDLSLLAKTGCKNIFFGIETGSPRMQKILNKNLNTELVYPTLHTLSRYDINFTLSFICGHPDETVEDIENTFLMCIKCKTLSNCNSIQIHKISPLAGSILLKQAKSKLYLDENNLSDQSRTEFFSEYKELIKSNPSLFSSFYTFSIEEQNQKLLDCIFDDGIKVINCFPRTIYCLIQEKIMSIYNVILLSKNIENFLYTIKTISKKLKNEILLDVFYFELELYKCYKEYAKERIADKAFHYNLSQRIIKTFDYVLNFDINLYKKIYTIKQEIAVRIWVNYKDNTVKYSCLEDSHKVKMNICKTQKLLNRMDKKTISNLISEGFVTGG